MTLPRTRLTGALLLTLAACNATYGLEETVIDDEFVGGLAPASAQCPGVGETAPLYGREIADGALTCSLAR